MSRFTERGVFLDRPGEALDVWRWAISKGHTHEHAVLEAARAVRSDPWAVVAEAGWLARCEPSFLDGRPEPIWKRRECRATGAFDTPPRLAIETVDAALELAGTVCTGLDPSCGTGALLLALRDRGIHPIGWERDALAAEVARIAVPEAEIHVGDSMGPLPAADVVVTNPPFVPAERQGRELRKRLYRELPWLSGRFDLSVVFAHYAVEAALQAAALLLPWPLLSQPYAAPMRRQWLSRHRLAQLDGPIAFPRAAVHLCRIVLESGAGPAPTAPNRVPAEQVASLQDAPLTTWLRPGDVAIARRVRDATVPLSELCEVDTGLVAHGRDGPKNRLYAEGPGPGIVRFADARELFAGRHRWLRYEPERMHRPKRPELFEVPKLVVQRLRGRAPVRAVVDSEGTYVGHTCLVAVPRPPGRVRLVRLRDAIGSPILSAVVRIERGDRLDLYPHDLAGWPVPRVWLEDAEVPVEEALGLDPADVERLHAIEADRTTRRSRS